MLLFLVFAMACGCAAATGALFPTGPWYRGLRRPDWTPPDRAFPIVWTTLYVLMAVAGARVAAVGGPGSGAALALWALQIAANTLWTPTVFGAHRLRLGLWVMAVLWVAVALCLVASWRVSALAGLCLVPYLAWVSVAAALNLALVRLNPAEAR